MAAVRVLLLLALATLTVALPLAPISERQFTPEPFEPAVSADPAEPSTVPAPASSLPPIVEPSPPTDPPRPVTPVETPAPPVVIEPPAISEAPVEPTSRPRTVPPAPPVQTPAVTDPVDPTFDGMVTATATPEITADPSPEEFTSTPEPSGSPPITIAPAESPTASPEDGNVCFPASATVGLEDGSHRRMDELKLGDRVYVGDGLFSEVFMFTHKMANVKHSFVRIETEAGSALELTSGHYLYLNGHLATARTARVGDVVLTADGSTSTISRVDEVLLKGLYNPQTVHGDIIVNGVRASTYTTAVHPKLSHALLAPLRVLYARLGFTTAVLDKGSDRLANCMPSGVSVLA